MSSDTTRSKGVMELIGTAALVCTIQLTTAGGGTTDWAPLAIGGILMVMVYAGGPISGAHYNPAVSLAVRLRGSMTVPDMGVYWACQLVGGGLGAMLGGVLNGGTFGMVTVGDGVSSSRAWLAEVVFTFLLCFVVLSVATNTTVSDNHYYGAAIGFVVTCGAIAVGPISGGAFNPAVALGLWMAKGIPLSHLVYTPVSYTHLTLPTICSV